MRRSGRAKLQHGPEMAGRKLTLLVLCELRQVRRSGFEFTRDRAIALAGGTVTRGAITCVHRLARTRIGLPHGSLFDDLVLGHSDWRGGGQQQGTQTPSLKYG